MKLFRIVHQDFSSLYNAFCGQGAASFGGRWNGKDICTIYSSSTIKTAVAEKGYYSIINNSYVLLNKTKLTDFDVRTLRDVPYVLVEAEFEVEQVKKNNFSHSGTLSSNLGSASLPDYHPSDSTYSPWEKLPQRWTSNLGKFLYTNSREGCVAYSARLNGGFNYIFFNDNYLISRIKHFSTEDIILSATNIEGTRKWTGKGAFSHNFVHYECPSKGMSGIVRVQNKQL